LHCLYDGADYKCIQHQHWDQVWTLFNKSIQQGVHPMPFIYFQCALGLLQMKQMDRSQVYHILNQKPIRMFIPNIQYKALIAEAKARGDVSLGKLLLIAMWSRRLTLYISICMCM